MSKEIDWRTAPAVPVKVFHAQAAGKDIGGTIVTGPMGQQTFVPDIGLPERRVFSKPTFLPGGVDGGVVHALPSDG